MTLPRFSSGSLADNSCLHRGAAFPLPPTNERILILATVEEERDFLVTVVSEQGLNAVACTGMEGLCREVRGEACIAILAAECLNEPHGDCLAKVLSEQPSWSDFPLIVLAGGGEAREAAWERLGGFEQAGNVKVMERPVPVSSLLNAVQVALRSRCRQYALRDQLLEAGRHQQAAEEAEERLRLTFESARDYAIFSLDLEGCVTSWNAGAEAVFGYAEREILGREAALLFTPEDRAEGVPQREMERAANSGRCGDDRWHLRKDGTRFFASGMLRPILNGAGNLLGFTKVARDVTWRKQVQENLARERNFSDAAINSLPGVFYLLDVQGHFLRWNENLERVSGYSGGEVSGMHPLHFMADDYRPLVAQKISEVFATGAATVEADLLCKNGNRVPYFFSGKRLLVEGQLCLIGMGIDITNQKHVQQELKELHALAERRVAELDAVIESMPDAVYIGTEAGITKCNTNALRMLGAGSLEDFNARIGESGSKFAVRWPDGRPLKTEELQFVRALHGELAIEDVVVRKADTGEDLYLRAASAPVVQNGRIVGAVSINSDLTQRKLAEEARANLAAIVESSDDAIIGKNLEGTITSWNAGAERIFGYRAGEAIGRPILMLLPPDRLAEESDITARLRRGEWVKYFETIRMAKGGREVEVSLTISPIRNASGNIIGASKIARDITERKQAEAALRVSRERLDMVTQLTEIGLWYCDLPFNKLLWSAKCKEHFGLPSDAEVTIDVFYDQIHPEDRGRTRQAIEKSIIERNNYDTDFRTMTLDGRMRWIRAIGRAFYDAGGKPLRFDGITVDVTRHKGIEQKLLTAKAQISRHAAELEKRVTERTARLQESIQSLEGVLYHVAHDLRAPLRAMQGFTSILLEEYSAKLDKKGGDYAQRISVAASRMDRLIQDLLAYGRLAHTPLSPLTVDLAQEIAVVQSRLTAEVEAKHALVQVEQPLPEVQADPVVLGEILAQLERNALTYVARGVTPRIRIFAEPAGPAFIRIWVEDNGVGIDPEHHERIFRVFERLQFEDVYTGTGIGLALVRKGVERMGGRAGLESKPGEGSRFWLELPAAAKNE
jgi:PAS domain S-box-containing protein